MTRIYVALLVIVAASAIAVGCGGRQPPSPTGVATSVSDAPNPVGTDIGPSSPDNAGAITIGAAATGTNAGSPTRCNSSRSQFTEARTGVVTDDSGKRWVVPAEVHLGDAGTDLYNDCTGTGVNRDYESQLRTVVIDPDGVEVTAFIHADNYFELYVNGAFVCRDPIAFTPFNSTTCRFRVKYPVTYALRGVDWEEHLGVGLEYDRMNVGDAGIVARFSDGTVTDETWKAEVFYTAPLDDPACVRLSPSGARDSSRCSSRPSCASHSPLTTCKALHFLEPPNWAAADFDDSAWPSATVYTREQFGPKEAYTSIERLFGGAKFVWSRNLFVDNLVLLRRRIDGPR